MAEDLDLQRVEDGARDLGRLLAGHPLVQRLRRLEEQIREDAALTALWRDLEDAESTSGGCGSGGCGSGGCGTKPEGAEGPPRRNGGPKPGEKMDLYARFSDEPVLQEYVQVRHRFYVLVDSLYATVFETAYGAGWSGQPVVADLDAEVPPPAVGFAGLTLVDPLED